MNKKAIIGAAIAALIAGLVPLATVAASGCSYTWAARATLMARDVGDAVSKGMAEQTRKVTADCKVKCIKADRLDLECYKGCIGPWRVHRERFRRYAAPAISGAVAGAYTGIKMSKDAGAGGDKAKAYGLGVLCAVLRIVDPFVPQLPKAYQQQVKLGSDFVKGMVCR
jgi:hypothetical protein